MKAVEHVPVEQTIQLYRSDLPRVLPIYLERAGYDLATNQNPINTRKIMPNSCIDFPLADLEGYSARYEWLSAVTRQPPITNHANEITDKESGHYVAWAHYDHKGHDAFVEYDSGTSKLHTDTASQVQKNVAQNSRLFIYEFRGLVKTKSAT